MSKQYLLAVDDANMAVLNRLCPGLQFIPVEGMNMKDNDKHYLLVSPLPPKPEVVVTDVPTEDVVPE